MTLPVQWLSRLVDAALAHRAIARPSAQRLRGARLVAHRGEHDNRNVVENSLAAFDAAAAAGVWGIELDVRWTADDVPVVFHDPDLVRLYGDRRSVEQMRFDELTCAFPEIPTLAAVVARYGQRLHLMIEIKAAPGVARGRFDAILQSCLAPLAPVRDYHLLSLVPPTLDGFPGTPSEAKIAIAQANMPVISRAAEQMGLGGIAGHYLLMTAALMRRHRRCGRKIGTGFIASAPCLYREIHRSVDWLFSNQAARLQRFLNGQQ